MIRRIRLLITKKNEYERYTVLTLILIFVKGQYVEKKKKKERNIEWKSQSRRVKIRVGFY